MARYSEKRLSTCLSRLALAKTAICRPVVNKIFIRDVTTSASHYHSRKTKCLKRRKCIYSGHNNLFCDVRKGWSGGGYAHANTFYAHLSMVNAHPFMVKIYSRKARKLVKKGTRFCGRGVVAWRGVAWWSRLGREYVKQHAHS